MKRIKTGITGLDQMLGGGIIEGRPYLVSGGPGSGKTIFGMQFLVEGMRSGEAGLFITLEEPAEEIFQNMATFAWDLEKISILELTPTSERGSWFVPKNFADSELNILNISDKIQKAVEDTGAKRLVMDSVTTMKSLLSTEFEIRKTMLSFVQFLSSLGCTSLLISEISNEVEVESFLARGVIRLHTISDRGAKKRACEIEKMRGMPFDEQLRPMKITDEGIVIYPSDTLFS
jgi:circadian clock protein KaiC